MKISNKAANISKSIFVNICRRTTFNFVINKILTQYFAYQQYYYPPIINFFKCPMFLTWKSHIYQISLNILFITLTNIQQLQLLIIQFIFQYQSSEMLPFFICLVQLIVFSSTQQLYNHQSTSYRNQTWMSTIDDGVPLRKISIIGSHSSMSTGTWGDAFQTQAMNLNIQLQAGYRALDIRCRHYNDRFPIHDRLVYLNIYFDGVLNIINTFLTNYPSQTVLVHIVQEYTASGNSRSFQETYVYYRDLYSSLIWVPTTQNPTLGQVRGKVVIIQNFLGNNIHGLLYSTFSSLPHKKYSTNWDQYDKWVAVKNFISSTETKGQSSISFWTGNFGSFPYFVASGKSSPGNSAPRLATGLTTPGFKSYYPDFPRVACFIGICTIAFEGINILGYNYIVNKVYNYLGIVFTDFAGDTLIQKAIGSNQALFGKCTTAQLSVGCTACSKTGICIGCNDVLNYILNTATDLCDAKIGYYLDSNSVPVLCSIALPGCLQCSSDIFCTACDTLSHYILSNNTCQAQSGYYLDNNSIPVKCSLTGCSQCSSATICTLCSSNNKYIIDNATSTCFCDSSLFFVQHPTIEACICDTGRYLINDSCQSYPTYPDPGSGCLTYSSGVCSLCDTANNFVPSNSICICDLNYYFDGLQCLLCNSTDPACQSCADQTLCLSCVDNFTLAQGVCICSPSYYAFDSDTCLTCQIGCLNCTSSTGCTLCDTSLNFKLVSGICQCEAGLYLAANESCVPCTAIVGCIDCTMLQCTVCDTVFGFSLSNGSCFCQTDYFVNAMSICQICSQDGCLQCTSLTECTSCNTTQFYLQSGQCKDICGDGILITLECDDGNTIDGDGCSSICQVEKDYTCTGGSRTSPSGCSFSGEIVLKVTKFEKKVDKNSFVVQMTIQPNLATLSSLNFSEIVSTSFPYSSMATTYDKNTGTILLGFDYDQSLNARQDLSITVTPPDTLQFYYTNATTAYLSSNTDNNLGLFYYDQNIYETAPILQVIVNVLLILVLLTFLIGFFFISKLIAVQFIAVYQIAYIGLIMIDRLQALIVPFTALRYTSGYNDLFSSTSSGLPSRISAALYKPYFLANFNINFLFIGLPLLIGVILVLIGLILAKSSKPQQHQQLQPQSPDTIRNNDEQEMRDISKQKNQSNFEAKSKVVQNKALSNVPLSTKIKRLGYRILKQYEYSALLFVSYHLIVSMGINLLYGSQQIYEIVFAIILLIGLGVQTILLLFRPRNFGDYKQFFVDNKIAKNYYLIVVLFRIVLAACIVFPNASIVCVILALAICLINIIVNCILRPYIYNSRPIFNLLIMLVILVCYTVYKIKIAQQSASNSISSYLPFFILALLFICLFVNIVFMTWHVKQLYFTKSEAQLLQEKIQEKQQEDNKTKELIKLLRQKHIFEAERTKIISPVSRQWPSNPHTDILKGLRKERKSKLTTEPMLMNQIYEEL